MKVKVKKLASLLALLIVMVLASVAQAGTGTPPKVITAQTVLENVVAVGNVGCGQVRPVCRGGYLYHRRAYCVTNERLWNGKRKTFAMYLQFSAPSSQCWVYGG